jgi:hypothetical protein
MWDFGLDELYGSMRSILEDRPGQIATVAARVCHTFDIVLGTIECAEYAVVVMVSGDIIFVMRQPNIEVLLSIMSDMRGLMASGVTLLNNHVR